MTQTEWLALGVPVFLAIFGIAFHAGLLRGKIKQLCDKCIQHDMHIADLNKMLTNHVDHLYKKVNEQAVAIASIDAKLDSVCAFIKGNSGSCRKEKR